MQKLNGAQRNTRWNAGGQPFRFASVGEMDARKILFQNDYWLYFVNNSQSVNCGQTFNCDYNQTWSLSFWMKCPSIPIRDAWIVGRKSGATVGVVFGINRDTGKPMFQADDVIGSSQYISWGTSNIADNTTHHMVFTYAPGPGRIEEELYIYVDSVKETQTGNASWTASCILGTDPWIIGNPWHQSYNHYTGWIDEVCLWPGVRLSQSVINSIYNAGFPTDNRELDDAIYISNYWRCGDGDDVYPTIYDIVGSNDGTMNVNMSQANIQTGAP